MLIHLGKRRAQFMKGLRAKRAGGKHAAQRQNPRCLGKNDIGSTPLEAQTRPPEVKSLRGKGQLFDVGGKTGVTGVLRQRQHRRGKIDAGNVRLRPAFTQEPRAVTCPATGIENPAGAGFRREDVQQARTDPTLQHRGIVIGTRSAVKGFAHALFDRVRKHQRIRQAVGQSVQDR